MEIDIQAQTVGQVAAGGGNGGKSHITTKRACDCCRKRKVRCDGQEPCTPCQKASIRCAYLTPPKKKGPKGLRSARVLNALRRIDTAASSPQSPEAQFGNWQWGMNAPSSGDGGSYHRQAPPEMMKDTQISPDQHAYYQHIPAASPQYPTYRPDPAQQSWPPQPAESVSAGSNGPNQGPSPASSDAYSHRALSEDAFLPFVQLFFNHMFAIMPVIDRNIYLDPAFYSQGLTSDVYCFLCALCAATVVQLDESIPQPPFHHPTKASDDLLAEECLRERKTFDYVERMSPLSVMTSFFLFCYYGNHEQHLQAWHYLQESITFAENLEMDDETSYSKLDTTEMQWRRRLYWLLFITERAYAVQRRKRTRLQASVTLPAVFSSEDPQLLNGFCSLANLFSAVDDSFVNAWRGTRRASLCDEAWLAQTQKQLDLTAQTTNLGELSEIQHLDIGVTREWLHVLAWQMGVSNGLIWGQGEGGMRLDYPVQLARRVVEITSNATPLSLDSHGIGMEQKLADVAGCLADVLRCTAGDGSPTFLEGKGLLRTLMGRLGSMRGKESRYLRPLREKVEGLVGWEVEMPLSLPLKQGVEQGPEQSVEQSLSTAWSMRESVSMLRHLSMAGALGMPGIAVAQEDYYQRRPSGRLVGEDDLEFLQPWLRGAS